MEKKSIKNTVAQAVVSSATTLEKAISAKLEYVVAGLVCILMLVFVVFNVLQPLEYKYYDTYLALKPEIKEDANLLMVCIDDPSIEEIGTYPWTRDIIADMMIRMRELGARTVVFDIEYLDPSSRGINPRYVDESLPDEYKAMQNEVTTSLFDFADAIGSKAFPASDAPALAEEIASYINPLMDDLFTSINANAFRNNDEYFAQALNFFGNSFVTINSSLINQLDSAKSAIDYAYDNFLYANVEDKNEYIKTNNARERSKQGRVYGLGPAILPLLQNSKGAGFPNVVVDEDGVRRRFELFSEYNGKYIMQLIFAPLMQIMQPEKVIRTKYSLTLKNALPPNGASGERHDIVIPLDDHGRVLTNWIKSSFADSFKNISTFYLYYIDKIELTLVNHIKQLLELNLKTSSGYFTYHEIASYLHTEYEALESMKNALLEKNADNFDEYFERRKTFFEDCAELFKGGHDQEIYDMFALMRSAYNDETLYQELEEQLKNLFAVCASDYELYQDEFARLSEIFGGAFCIVGNNSVGTTDLGITPFESYYPNVGTHANLYNTIVNEDFIRPLPRYISVILMCFSCIVVALLFRRLQTLSARFIAGFITLIVAMTLLFGAFALFSIYIESLAIIVAIILTFVIITIGRFLLAEKDKNFLRKAFSTYLSNDIIDEIVKDPNKLKLGGQEKELTAIFTDVKSFSTLSEKVTPTQLVSILNKYLSRMSDIVLEHKGTIDKFEGDAIIAFYGAPVDNPEHARMALLSAIRMKQAEVELNKVLVESGEAPNELLTRVGINSGPMVVGNMGTDAKMNYTIMGNDVNLAARLEGVNKVYGTWILASEFSYKKAGPGFLGRRLDRVRVVGINTPVQLYNVMGVLDEMPQQTIDGIGVFHEALDLYLAQEFEKSIEKFNAVLKILPEDPPSLVYLERAEKLIKTGVPDGWDGVVNMTSK